MRLLFNTFQLGIENLKSNFIAFEALNNRTDLGKILINKYQILAAKKIDSESLITKGEHSVKLSFIELMLGQKFTISSLTQEELISVLKTLINNYYNKKNEPGIYGTMSLSTCAWAINNMLIFSNADKKFLVNSKYVEDGNVFSQEILKVILSKAQKYIETVSQR